MFTRAGSQVSPADQRRITGGAAPRAHGLFTTSHRALEHNSGLTISTAVPTPIARLLAWLCMSIGHQNVRICRDDARQDHRPSGKRPRYEDPDLAFRPRGRAPRTLAGSTHQALCPLRCVIGSQWQPACVPAVWVPLPVVGHGHRAARRNDYVWLRRDPFVIGEQRMLCGYMYARSASWEPCLPGRSGHGTDSATSRWHVPLRRP
jgi:hypothetical protein